MKDVNNNEVKEKVFKNCIYELVDYILCLKSYVL